MFAIFYRVIRASIIFVIPLLYELRYFAILYRVSRACLICDITSSQLSLAYSDYYVESDEHSFFRYYV